jgi:hypothetical protein
MPWSPSYEMQSKDINLAQQRVKPHLPLKVSLKSKKAVIEKAI